MERRVVFVDSEQGLDLLEAALFDGAAEAGSGGNSDASTAGSGSSADGGSASGPRGFGSGGALAGLDGSTVRYHLVVGLDCEWQPYERGQPKSAVSLLQLATPEAVFLLDMLALCGPGSDDSRAGAGQGGSQEGGNSAGGDAEAFSASGGADAGIDACGSVQDAAAVLQGAREGETVEPAATAAPQLPPLQHRLSSLLARLFGDAGIVKAGFGMSTDLQRLCESYPALPCFGSQGSVPLR